MVREGLAALAAFGAMTMGADARTWSTEEGRHAAFLFSYDIDRGRESDFTAAYQQHLQWHVDHNDHLAWYGWFVANGPRVGAFVDGTFGVSLEEYDRRPALADDARHFTETVAPFARSREISQLSLWPEVSTAFSLEQWAPSRLLDVWRIELAPSAQAEFEQALTEAARSANPANADMRWAWYRTVSGYARPTYLVLSPRNAYAEATGDRSSLPKLAALAYGASPQRYERLGALVQNVESETWSYRADLSSFPRP